MSQAAPLDPPVHHFAPRRTIALQTVSLAWLGLECGVSGFAALTSHSAAIAAFGSDSLVELLSALVVLAQWIPGVRLSERNTARAAAVLLALLAMVVLVVAVGGLVSRHGAEVSRSGLAIAGAALVVMPSLAALKRNEARRTGNVALRADAVQSATCAYLALISLVGLGLNAILHKPWLDSAAALVAIPLLLREAREAWRGAVCRCC